MMIFVKFCFAVLSFVAASHHGHERLACQILLPQGEFGTGWLVTMQSHEKSMASNSRPTLNSWDSFDSSAGQVGAGAGVEIWIKSCQRQLRTCRPQAAERWIQTMQGCEKGCPKERTRL
jgi:hypothetical protein